MQLQQKIIWDNGIFEVWNASSSEDVLKKVDLGSNCIIDYYPGGQSRGSVSSSLTNSLLRHQYPGGQTSFLRFDWHRNPWGHSAESACLFFVHQKPGGHLEEACSSILFPASSAMTDEPNKRVKIIPFCSIPSNKGINRKLALLNVSSFRSDS